MFFQVAFLVYFCTKKTGTLDFSQIVNNYRNLNSTGKITNTFKSGINQIYLKGLKGSASAIQLGASFLSSKKWFLITLNDKESAAYFYNDLQNIVGNENAQFLPSSFNDQFNTERLKAVIFYSEPIF